MAEFSSDDEYQAWFRGVEERQGQQRSMPAPPPPPAPHHAVPELPDPAGDPRRSGRGRAEGNAAISGTPDDHTDDTEDTFTGGFGAPVSRNPPPPDADDVRAQIMQLLDNNPEALQQMLSDARPAGPAPAQPPAAVPAPRQHTTVDPDAERADVARRGVRGFLARSLHMPVSKSRAERHADALEQAMSDIRQFVQLPQVIGVTSFKGGCGKTPAALEFALKLAAERPERVAVLDADLHGTLLARAVNPATVNSANLTTMTMMASRITQYGPAGLGGLEGQMQWVNQQVAVLPGARPGEPAPLSGDQFRAVINHVRGEFPFVIIDMSPVSITDLFGAVLQSLTGLVMVTPPHEGATAFLSNTSKLLHDINVDYLSSRRMTVINNLRDLPGTDVDALEQSLRVQDPGTPIGHIPFDRHIAQDITIDPAQLQRRTQDDMTLATAGLMRAIATL